MDHELRDAASEALDALLLAIGALSDEDEEESAAVRSAIRALQSALGVRKGKPVGELEELWDVDGVGTVRVGFVWHGFEQEFKRYVIQAWNAEGKRIGEQEADDIEDALGMARFFRDVLLSS